jgi:hypothetical protein
MAPSTRLATIISVVLVYVISGLRHVRGFERSDEKGPGEFVAQLYMRSSYRSFSDSGQLTSRNRKHVL